MAVPKKRTSVARKGLRWAGHTFKLHAAKTMKCPNCGSYSLPHRACMSCGHYRGRQILTIKAPKNDDTGTENQESTTQA